MPQTSAWLTRKQEKCLQFSAKPTNARRMVARGVSCRWEKRNTRARTWSVCVGAFRLTLRRAHTRRPYAVRRAKCGSVMPMLRMSGGIRACSPQVKRMVRRRSHRFPSRAVPLVAAMPLSLDKRAYRETGSQQPIYRTHSRSLLFEDSNSQPSC